MYRTYVLHRVAYMLPMKMHLKYLWATFFSPLPSPSCSRTLYLLAVRLKLSFIPKWSFMNRRLPPSPSPTPSRQWIARQAHTFSLKWSMSWNLLGIWWVHQMSDCDWVCPLTSCSSASDRTLYSACDCANAQCVLFPWRWQQVVALSGICMWQCAYKVTYTLVCICVCII